MMKMCGQMGEGPTFTKMYDPRPWSNLLAFSSILARGSSGILCIDVVQLDYIFN